MDDIVIDWWSPKGNRQGKEAVSIGVKFVSIGVKFVSNGNMSPFEIAMINPNRLICV